MSFGLIFAIVSMMVALSAYSIGVWGERLAKTIRLHHIVFFWIGFVFDTAGTTQMASMAGSLSGSAALSLHGVTGAIALVLMAVHAVWATVVFAKGNEKQKTNFHRFSILVWIIWLIPFFSGMIMAMGH